MSLRRTKERRTITLGGFSFADGLVDLINPNDMPHNIMLDIRRPDGNLDLEDFLTFNVAEGILDPDDFIVLDEMTSTEVNEFMQILINNTSCECPAHRDPSESTTDIPPLTPEQEAEVQAFSDFLNGLTSANGPEQSEDDEDGDDGLTAV
ncbi:hypothetical protein [Brevibacterium sp. CFH 10365]|uniref:hypothetical protein n=1 Tax=Brevibacterium sp. CFH 10365 TaxID=2585207 RepID=UPI0012668490|nr:hypothetical protein [Brevibacterium sp. CFH 10365]